MAATIESVPSPNHTPPLNFTPSKNLACQNFQKHEEHSRTIAHYNKFFSTYCKLAMTSEEQNAAIRADLYNEDTLPKEKDIQIAICKNTRLIKPHTNDRHHAAAALINAYAESGCLVDCR